MSDNNISSNRENGKSAPATGFDGYYHNGAPAGRSGTFQVNINDRDYNGASSRPQRTPAPRTTPYSAPVAGRRVVPQNQPPRRTAAPAQGAQNRNNSGQTAQQKPRKRKKVMTKAQKERRKYRRIRGGLIFLTVVICIAILTAIASAIVLSTINDILKLNKTGSDTVVVEIQPGSDFEDVYNVLCENDLVKQKMLCKLFLKFRHYDGYYSKSLGRYVDIVYEPGVYYFESGDGLEDMMEAIKQSRTVSKDTIRLNFPEGWTIAKIFERIEKYNVCTAEKLYANLDIVGKQFKFYERINAKNGRYLKAEGYIFPDTYDFYIGEQASSVLKKLFNNFQSKWTKEFTARAKEIGMTRDQVITLASIIQREAKDSTQMAVVSSVLHNRLDHPELYPQLQMNSTKEYVTAVNEYGLFNEVYYSIYLDAYNTYSVTGLPAGPICNPGLSAIKAALYPDDTNYFFFCHDSDGNIYLAETAEEHQKNTEKVLFS